MHIIARIRRAFPLRKNPNGMNLTHWRRHRIILKNNVLKKCKLFNLYHLILISSQLLLIQFTKKVYLSCFTTVYSGKKFTSNKRPCKNGKPCVCVTPNHPFKKRNDMKNFNSWKYSEFFLMHFNIHIINHNNGKYFQR